MIRLTVDAALGERLREEVVGHRSLGRDALEAHRDRVRLPRPDPDGQVPVVAGVAQDDDVLRGHHVDADALDDHLVERTVCAPLLLLSPGPPLDMAEFYSRSGRGRGLAGSRRAAAFDAAARWAEPLGCADGTVVAGGRTLRAGDGDAPGEDGTLGPGRRSGGCTG